MVVSILTIFVFISANFIDDQFDSVTFHNIKSDTYCGEEANALIWNA